MRYPKLNSELFFFQSDLATFLGARGDTEPGEYGRKSIWRLKVALWTCTRYHYWGIWHSGVALRLTGLRHRRMQRSAYCISNKKGQE